MINIAVAVWMVTYNHENYVEQAVESVMMQNTDFKFKLFIGEDASTDKTRDVLMQLKTKYPDKIDLTLNKTNLGSTKNAINMYNKCLDSSAKYIALIEGDDYWTDPFKLQKQVNLLEANKKNTFSMTRFFALKPDKSLVDENARFFKSNSDISYDFDFFTRGWYGGTLTLVFRASVIDQKIFTKYKFFRDIHLYTELLKKGNGICQNFTSAVYRIHNQGQYSSLNNLERARIAELCYRELVIENNHIPQIVKKYRYFHSEYIKSLLSYKKKRQAITENFKSLYFTKDWFVFKKEIKRIVRFILFAKT